MTRGLLIGKCLFHVKNNIKMQKVTKVDKKVYPKKENKKGVVSGTPLTQPLLIRDATCMPKWQTFKSLIRSVMFMYLFVLFFFIP